MAQPAILAPPAPSAPRRHGRETMIYQGSLAAGICAAILAAAFVVFTAIRVSGATAQVDLRIVAHLVPVRDHTRLLKLVHP
ncbi:MAG: hypothetical protein ACRDG4_07230, partial [Chloroflexota bacterium]